LRSGSRKGYKSWENNNPTKSNDILNFDCACVLGQEKGPKILLSSEIKFWRDEKKKRQSLEWLKY
jgi:hypothetical protein